MPSEQDIQRALGRYRVAWWSLALQTATPLLLFYVLVLGIVRGRADGRTYVLAVGVVLVVILVWGLPATVVTTNGFRRGFRFTSWAEVATVLPARPGHRNTLIGLRNSEKISLIGVGEERRPGVIALAGRASP